MSAYEKIIEDFKTRCLEIMANHKTASESMGGMGRVNTVVTGMGAQLKDVNTEIAEEVDNVLGVHSENTAIDAANLKDNLLAIGKEMTEEYISNNKLK